MSRASRKPSSPTHFDLVSSPLTGFNLIDASAGTGKTYAICGLVLRLLLEKRFTIDQILVVTYTEAATEDLRVRIRQQLRQALESFHSGGSDDNFLQQYLPRFNDFVLARQLLTAALRSFDEAAIFTIHSFCQRILREYSFESGTLFDTELITDDTYIIEEIVEDFWRRNFYRGSSLFIDYVSKKLSPEKLFGFLAHFIPHPHLTLIPVVDPQKDLADLQTIEEDFTRTCLEVCSTWPLVRDQVTDIMQHSKALNRRSYGLKKIPDWLTAMDLMSARCNPAANLFDTFTKFTSSKIGAATKKNETVPHHPFFDLCEQLVQLQDNLLELFEIRLLALKSELAAFFRDEFPKRKQKENIYSFDDLLRRLHDSLKGAKGTFLAKTIAQKYPAALVDEFQDTDPLQFDIFTTIYRHDSLLFLIGDPKQAIYSFRGADIFTYMHAAAAADSNAHHTLGVNYRSNQGLVKAVNTLFSQAPTPFLFNEIVFQPVAPSDLQNSDYLAIDNREKTPFILWFFDRPPTDATPGKRAIKPLQTITKNLARQRIIAAVTQEITRLLSLSTSDRTGSNCRKIIPSDIAVLVRTNREARLMQQALNDRRVPSVLHSGENLFASREAREIEILLSAVAEPNNIRKVKTALLTDIITIPENTIRELDNLTTEYHPEIEYWLTAFRNYFHLWNRYGFIRMFWTFMSENKLRSRLLAYENGERSLTNILHLAELLHQAAAERSLSINGLLSYLRERLANQLAPDIEHQLRLESDADRVRIVTIHKAKGLEYPIVFCPFTWEGTKLANRKECIFHRRQTPDKGVELVFDAGSADLSEHLRAAMREELAENLRLLYVALTRAVHRCYLIWGPFNGAETSAPAYLLHQPPVAASSQAEKSLRWQDTALLQDTSLRFKALTDQEIRADLSKFVAESGDTIKLSVISEGSGLTKFQQKHTEDTLHYCKFTGDISTDWRIASFSSLALTKRSDTIATPSPSIRDTLPDRDAAPIKTPSELPITGAQDKESNIFSFPHGAGPGTFFHDLLEHLDFSSASADAVEKLSKKKLTQYGYDISWSPVIEKMIDNLLHMELHTAVPGLQLSKIGKSNRLNELEFYFPLASISPADLADLFTGLPGQSDTDSAPLAGQLGKLIFSPVRGFMKGFIDMVFKFEDRYYLVDWKSNYLGNGTGDYELSKLQQAIHSRYYFLQYHIYCLALHQYLRNRLPGYQYETHFGGVFYIFLRGVNRRHAPGCGIFYDLPDSLLINRLAAALLPGNGAPRHRGIEALRH